MAKHIRSLSKRARLVYGVGCLALGCYPIAMALGYVSIDEAESTAPRWVVAGAGLTFVVAGFMILLAKHSRANDLLAGVLLLLFGILGTWVAVFSSGEGFSGGLPFLSSELNIKVGRWVFGLGAMICFAFCVYAFRRATTRSN
ncbi:MAG: hypothetical protein QNJ07_09420 [Woeseiaceae bacterium]|nr:hypothetical protein [Woeseiaceae bacterium]